MSYPPADFLDDLFPSLPIRSHGLGHVGTAVKYDAGLNKWMLGKFSDISVEVTSDVFYFFLLYYDFDFNLSNLIFFY